MILRFLLVTSLFLPSFFPGEACAGGRVTVSAASSLTDAFKEAGAAFEKETGVRVMFNFGASVSLLKQIEAGAPVDVFASADEMTMDKAEKTGLVLKATRRDFAGNDLVLAVPAVPGRVTGMKDIYRASKIAIANPDTAPAGRYAKKALTEMSLWDALEPKFIYGANVRQVLDYIRRGEVDAGFVYTSDVVSTKGGVKALAVIGESARYPAAVVSLSKDRKAAQGFVDFLAGREARAIWKKNGFKGL